MKRWAYAVGIVIGIGIIVASIMLLPSCWSNRARSKVYDYNQEVAVELIQAIEQYEEDTGSIPRDLEQLVPDYLSDLPTTKGKQSFVLEHDPDRSSLCFYVNRRQTIGCCYLFRLAFWDCFRNYGLD